MKRPGRAARQKWPAIMSIPVVMLASSACLGYPTDGSVATPTAPGQSAPSRLPTLLQQLQQGTGGLELFDRPQNQVLAAQDAQGKGEAPANATVAPTQGNIPISFTTPTPVPAARTQAPATQPPRTQAPTSTPAAATQQVQQATPTPTAAAQTATPTASQPATPTPSTATPTPTPTIPREGGGGTTGTATPPTER